MSDLQESEVSLHEFEPSLKELLKLQRELALELNSGQLPLPKGRGLLDHP